MQIGVCRWCCTRSAGRRAIRVAAGRSESATAGTNGIFLIRHDTILRRRLGVIPEDGGETGIRIGKRPAYRIDKVNTGGRADELAPTLTQRA